MNCFKRSAPDQVFQYFNKNWHKIKGQWEMGDKFKSGNFLNSTNNRVESLNGKLKYVIDHHSSLETFIDDLFSVIYVLRNEKCHKAVISTPLSYKLCRK